MRSQVSLFLSGVMTLFCLEASAGATHECSLYVSGPAIDGVWVVHKEIDLASGQGAQNFDVPPVSSSEFKWEEKTPKVPFQVRLSFDLSELERRDSLQFRIALVREITVEKDKPMTVESRAAVWSRSGLFDLMTTMKLPTIDGPNTFLTARAACSQIGR